MASRIVSGIFSFSGASVMIGVAGFLSALVGMFIDVSAQVSVKWLLFVIWVFSTLALIMLKVIYDVANEVKPTPPFESPIKYIQEDQIFVIRRNENFLNQIVVGCYLQRDDVERLAYIGVVHIVQDKVIQIKIRVDMKMLKEIPSSIDELKSIVVRPVVPVTALQQFSGAESSNE